jgi:hypothetical protein
MSKSGKNTRTAHSLPGFLFRPFRALLPHGALRIVGFHPTLVYGALSGLLREVQVQFHDFVLYPRFALVFFYRQVR